MNVATVRNFDLVYPQHVRERFWGYVRRALTEVFGSSPDAAEKYRRQVEKAPVEQRMLVYHQEPIKVAAVLAGFSEISEEQLGIYRELIGSDESTRQGLPDVP